VHVTVPCLLFARCRLAMHPLPPGLQAHATQGACQCALLALCSPTVSGPACASGYRLQPTCWPVPAGCWGQSPCRLLQATGGYKLPAALLRRCAAAPLHRCTAALQATSAQALTAPVAARRSARSANQPNSQPANALTPSWPAALLHRCTAEAHALTAPVAAAPTLTQCS
jgi:hypothetical protein